MRFVLVVFALWLALGIVISPSVYVGTVITYADTCDNCRDPSAVGFAIALALHLACMAAYAHLRYRRAGRLEWIVAGATWAVVTPVTVVVLPIMMAG